MARKKRGKDNFLKRNYKLSWNYLKESKNFIYLAVLAFFGFAVIGFLYPNFFRQEIIDFLNELVQKTQNLNQFEMIKFIFLNNLQSSLIGMIFGIFLGIIPLIILIINGYVLGFVSYMAVNESGIGVLWKLFPHGIFELPAVFISLGLGMKLGAFIFQKNKLNYFKKSFMNSIRIFVFIVIPLLIIAAIIEGTLILMFG